MDATLMSRKELGTNGLKQYLFDIVGLATNTVSAETRFEFGQEGFLVCGLHFACSSTNVNLSLCDQSGVSTPSVHEVFTQSSINQSYSDYTLGIPIFHDTDSLYSIVGNKDTANHTGSISILFLIR
ncbi:hypothetical protein [Methanomethylovorans sp.]|uniref:hypothetical protein n=1 Tax=Methanomethylovorans sp. TaxID=2758717 RepID=UPI00351C06AC